MDIENLRNLLRNFAQSRNWEQFHNPKNLSMALTGEAAELLEIFQWLNEAQSFQVQNEPKTMSRVKEEMADILLYLIRISDVLKIDLEEVALNKIKLNELKYPVELSKNNATKYNRRNG